MLKFEVAFVYCVRNSIIPVKIKAKLKNNNEEKLASIVFLSNNPTIPAGIVAVIRNSHNFLYLGLNDARL